MAAPDGLYSTSTRGLQPGSISTSNHTITLRPTMALSVQRTTSAIPALRLLLDEWDVDQAKLEVSNGTGPDTSLALLKDKDVVVAFRTRPPLADETRMFEGEVEDPEQPSKQAEFLRGVTVRTFQPVSFVAHVPSVSWKGHTIAHKEFESDLAFGPETTNDDVYKSLIESTEVIEHALNGGAACILAYGQTSSGKTFSISGLEERLSRDLFSLADSVSKKLIEAHKDTKSAPVFDIEVNFLELLGKVANDLAIDPADGNDEEGQPARPRVDIIEDRLGQVRPKLVTTTVTSPDQMNELITRCLSHRRTQATTRNDRSSRSHAILTIRIRNRLTPQKEEGQIVMVDLAGSERHTDAKLHSRERLDENKDTNKSLMCLKDCVQARAKAAYAGFVHIPYRNNKLTLLLKSMFDLDSRQHTKTIVIAHVSPHIQDAAHSANTLSYAAPFRSVAPKYTGPAPVNTEDPRTWDHDHSIDYLKRGLRHELLKLLPASSVPKQLPIDLEKFLPAPSGGLQLCRVYGPEWVAGILTATEWEGTKRQRLEKAAYAVYVSFTERLRVARTQGKADVFKRTAPDHYSALMKGHVEQP
ncbi:P-loop containing nucleoside triphosphate hydrolase protein [Auriculariales sp. MPI-PUGE-AT-0066]|nr:P-loop containing nucleoside triphosphate hydrolase protein [Auriculariales sp. MPI-PUGE-AT-0066]